MNRRSPWAAAGALCGALLTVACDVKVGDGGLSVDIADGRATDEWARTYTLAAGGRLEILNTNGRILVSRSDGSEVEVRATRTARAGSEEASREMLQRMQIREDAAPDRVVIESPEPGGGGFRGPRLSVEYDVRVPPGLDVLFKTQNGNIRLENVDATRVAASSTNGGITGRGISAAVQASTVNGGIQLDLARVTGDTRIATINGGIVLSVATDVAADLEATVVNGAVVVQDRLPLAADERTRQRVAGRINGGGPRIVVEATNGGIRIEPRGEPGA